MWKVWWSWSAPLPVWQQLTADGRKQPDPCSRFGSKQLGTQCLFCWFPSFLLSCSGFCYVSFSGKRRVGSHGAYATRQWHSVLILFDLNLLQDLAQVFPEFKNVQSLRLVLLSSSSRWLICTLAVRVFQTALNADLKIKSVGLFSVHGLSIQFHPQHTLVRHTAH